MQEGVPATLRRNLYRALGEEDREQAALLLERLKQEDPLSVETRGSELYYLLRSGRLGEARLLAEQLVELFATSPRIHYVAGQVAYRNRQYDLAAERFRESHALHPDWRTSLWRAKSLTQLGELEEAAGILEPLVAEHPECALDLAWLYERRGWDERALTTVEKYLQRYADSEMAEAQRARLRARLMSQEELIEETEGLIEFGEEISDSVVPEYVEALLRTGRRAEAQRFVWERGAGFSAPVATRTGWVCYRSGAYDLAFDLFVATFDTQLGNAKFLSALEFASKRTGRDDRLIELYGQYAQQDRRLFGRLHRLRRRVSESDTGA